MFSSRKRPSPSSTIGWASNVLSPPATSPRAIASPITNRRMCTGSNPSARKTPYSRVRSRTPMAMVLPTIINMMSRMIMLMTSRAVSSAPYMLMKERFIDRSLMVAVCISRSSNMRSIAADTSAPRPGSSMRLVIQPI